MNSTRTVIGATDTGLQNSPRMKEGLKLQHQSAKSLHNITATKSTPPSASE